MGSVFKTGLPKDLMPPWEIKKKSCWLPIKSNLWPRAPKYTFLLTGPRCSGLSLDNVNKKKVKLVRKGQTYKCSCKFESNCITYQKRFNANMCLKKNRENPKSKIFFTLNNISHSLYYKNNFIKNKFLLFKRFAIFKKEHFLWWQSFTAKKKS